MKTPDITAAQAVAIISSIIAVAVAFGVNLSDAQVGAVLGLVTVLGSVLLGSDAAIRRKRAEVFGSSEPAEADETRAIGELP